MKLHLQLDRGLGIYIRESRIGLDSSSGVIVQVFAQIHSVLKWVALTIQSFGVAYDPIRAVVATIAIIVLIMFEILF